MVPGRQNIPLSTAGARLPGTVRLVDIEPSSLELDVVRLVEIEIKVNPQIIGDLGPGLELRAVQVNPPVIRLLVPENGSDHPAEIMTGPIHMAGIRGSTQIISRVVSPPGARPVGDNWPEVTVSIDVGPGNR